MALVNEVVDTETLIGFLLCFVIIKLSSIKTGAFNLPHKLLSGLLICIPSTESLNNLNESKQSFQKTKKKHKGAPIVRKHKTINDRVEALQYEVEPVESGMLMRYSCWEEYDSLVLFSLCCMIGFVVIEGWRLWEHQRAIDPMQTGSCLESAQMRVKSAQAENSGHIYFGYFMSYVVLEAGRIPHTYMYDKVLNWALGLLVAFFFFMYMHTPALEKHMELPLSAVADDIAVRFALWNRLVDNSSMWPDYWAENGGVFVRVLMSLYVAYLVAGFGHSLGQLSKVTTYILNSKKGKMTPDKILVVMMASVPLLVTLTYFFNAELSNMTLFKAPPVVIRSILTLFWSFLYMLLVPRHLQFYMQQGFKDSVKELRAHHVNAEKVRMHFQKRVTLVVYSACQYCCFPLFVVTYLLYTGHKSGVGTLGHARPFTLGNFETGPELAPVVSRSTLYDAFQAAMKNSNLGVCDVLPEGSYSDEEEGYSFLSSKDMWEQNKGKVQFSLNDMWEDTDNFRDMIKEIPYARHIIFSKKDFDDSLLISKDDQKRAKELKDYKDRVGKLLFPMISHSFVSPPFLIVWIDCLGAVLCFLWCSVYIYGVIRHIRNKEMIEYDFTTEISETEGGADSGGAKKDN